jgi:gamma-glutamyltranspeptidase/glutathione hydrolase
MHTTIRIAGISLVLYFVSVFAGPDASRASGSFVSGKTVAADSAVVVTADSIASLVGAEVLRKGGNAVDAAVAVGFALAVTYPRAGNLGGGGFMLVRLASGETHFIDYRETAPAAAARDMYLDAAGKVIEDKSTVGYLASGVPGTIAGLALAHRRFGSLPWSDLVSYAQRLALEGFAVDRSFLDSIEEERKLLSKNAETRRIFIDSRLRPGDILVQPELAATLSRIMGEGEEDFYRGRTAELIVEEMKRGGGIITTEDLAAYRPRLRDALRASYRGYEIVSAPLPSSGGIILSELFQILELYDLGALGHNTRDHVHLVAEAEKVVYRLRALYMGDSDFFPAPFEGLVSPGYIDRLRAMISPSWILSIGELEAADLLPPSDSTRAAPQPRRDEAPRSRVDDAPRQEPRETTHFSIVDRWGNAVSNTYTLNGSFGSGVTVAGAGFLLNNEMDDFSIKPGYSNLYGLVGSEANAIEPGKRMLSSMAPTIVLRDGELFMVVGSPGGSTIPTAIFQVISNVVDFRMTLEEAVAAARFHNQYLPDRISVEPASLPADVVAALEALGHTIFVRDENIGDIQAILLPASADRPEVVKGNGRPRDPRSPEKSASGRMVGASDPRGSGRAIGY